MCARQVAGRHTQTGVPPLYHEEGVPLVGSKAIRQAGARQGKRTAVAMRVPEVFPVHIIGGSRRIGGREVEGILA
jgi:hypothetical protein